MNFDRLRFVAERAELGEAREAVFAATIPERPGSFKEFCRLLGRSNITEFNYRFADPAEAHVFVGLERARPRREGQAAARARAGRHQDARPDRQRDGEAPRPPPRRRAARTRRTRSSTASSSPSGPGALMRFLDAMSQDWNISLFHYRNHGADYGRVLAGIQVPPKERRAFRESLRTARLPVRRGDREPGGSALPRRLRAFGFASRQRGNDGSDAIRCPSQKREERNPCPYSGSS